MKRHELEHIIRAAGVIAQAKEIYVIGSQAILGSYSDLPEELIQSIEADLWPADCPQKADLIDGCIGEMPPFHETFGYYAHGVGPETATLPKNWKKRIIKLVNENTNGITGLCLHPLDIAISKLIAGREKDINFIDSLLRNKIISKDDIFKLLVEIYPKFRKNIKLRLSKLKIK